MKKMMDPVMEAEKIIEAYVGGKSLAKCKKKKIPVGYGVLFSAGIGGGLLTALMFFYL